MENDTIREMTHEDVYEIAAKVMSNDQTLTERENSWFFGKIG